jgi:L,D-transpeptidase YbiS
MKANRLFLAVVALPVVVLAVMHNGLGYQWDDPHPTSDSLALEARGKLAGFSGACLENGALEKVPRPAEAGRPRGVYIVVDTHTNRLYLRQGNRLLVSALCSTGTGAELVDSEEGRRWRFDTPKGFFRVDSKVDNPWWRKPDWAYIEEGAPLPEDDDERLDPKAMGDFAIGFGDGYFIHGTTLERLIGVSVTHGCVRMRSEELKEVYDAVGVGTPVIIF